MNTKEEIRKTYLAARKTLSVDYIEAATAKINEKLFSYMMNFIGMKIGVYYPIANEINILPAITKCINHGVNIAVPVVDNSLLMEFKLWQLDTHFSKHPKHNFLQPCVSSIPVVPDVLIVPLVTCDRLGNRIGYGKGYYDRYIARHNIRFVVGVCYSKLIYQAILPNEQDDQKLNVLINEDNIVVLTMKMR